MLTIYLPALDRHVTMRQYLDAVRLAKTNQARTFKTGLSSWWPTTGTDIMRQFRHSIHDRINQAISYHIRAKKEVKQ